MEILNLRLEEIKPYEKNPRNNDNAVDAVANSIREFGFKVPIIIDKDNVIVAGHTRYKASQKLGLKTVPCIKADDLNEEQIKAFRLADNKVSEQATWDFKLLDEELDGITMDMEQFGFVMDEEVEIVEDEVPDVPEEPKSKSGYIYILGNHRLMCGDSTKEEDVKKLIGDFKMDLLITDPPYNVEIVGGNHSESPAERKKKGNLTIQNDKMDNDSFHDFLLSAFKNAYMALKDGAAFYCWYASKEVVNFHSTLEEAGFSVKQELIWNKSSLVMGRQDYQWKHEPCLYGWKETNSHMWYGDRKQTTVIDWERPTKADLHPTMKPIGLFDYQIKNSSKQGDSILDLFGGSGTTLMACEQNNRNAFIMEYDPRYVDVIIQRWENFTGKKAKLLNERGND